MTMDAIVKAKAQLDLAGKMWSRAQVETECIKTLENPGAVSVEVKDQNGAPVGLFYIRATDLKKLQTMARNTRAETVRAMEKCALEAIKTLQDAEKEYDAWETEDTQ